jgi:hypothetical protein
MNDTEDKVLVSVVSKIGYKEVRKRFARGRGKR